MMPYSLKQSSISRDYAASSMSRRSKVPTSRERRLRLGFLACAALLFGSLIISRLVSLQLNDFERWKEWASKQHLGTIQLASERGPILDREGRSLALSVAAGSVFVRPKLIRTEEERISLSQNLAKLLKLNQKAVLEKFKSKQPFVWIARQIPRSQADKVQTLNHAALNVVVESRRYYPYGRALSRALGKVGLDGNGLSGIELAYNDQLSAASIENIVMRDALGKTIAPVRTSISAVEIPRGESLYLTVDADLQLMVDQELEAGRLNARAKGALAVMVDSVSGEILALSQAPYVDFNLPLQESKTALQNVALEMVYEPGSTFKPMVAAAALEQGLVRVDESIDCENGSFIFAKHNVSDVHPSGKISFFDVLVRSSNIGMTKIGMRLGESGLYAALAKFGFGERSGVGLPGESPGILRGLKDWTKVDLATHSFGQGVAVTPLQMVRAISALATDGSLPPLSLISDYTTVERRNVVSPRVAEQIRDMLYGVVENKHGTGRQAAIEGVRVGGKTGTAQKAKPNGRGYSAGLYVASFVGFADLSTLGIDKILSMIVLIDEPNTTSIYGGTLAAPVFKRIMQRTILHLATKNELRGGRITNQGFRLVKAARL